MLLASVCYELLAPQNALYSPYPLDFPSILFYPHSHTEAIDYYSSCEVVKHIYIIWSETVPPPGRISAKYEKSRNPSVSE
jgi:hypothetical protein